MKKILVVDDEESIRVLIKEALENDEYEFVEANDGDAALKLVSNNKFDLVITDIVMPKKNGIDLIIGMSKVKSDTPIIAISGGGGITGRFEYLPIAKLVGAIYIIEKPFEISSLRETIELALAS